jgi:hypothetical protein
VVVAVGDTARVLVPVTEPMPLSRLRLAAPLTVHERVDDCPAVMLAGAAANAEIVGGGAGGGGGATGLDPPPPPHPARADIDDTTNRAAYMAFIAGVSRSPRPTAATPRAKIR